MEDNQAREIVSLICDALTPILPTSFQLRQSGDSLALVTPNGTEFFLLRQNFEERLRLGLPLIEAIALAIVSMLSELQDVITESLATPWPEAEGLNQGVFAEPHCEIHGHALRIWFGERTEVHRMIEVRLNRDLLANVERGDVSK